MDKGIGKFLFIAVMVFFAAYGVQHGLAPSMKAEGDVQDGTEISVEQSVLTGNVSQSSRRIQKLPFMRTSSTPAPQLSSHAALIGDIKSGEVYMNENTADLWPAASITKLMTAVVVSENMDLNDSIVLEVSDLEYKDRRFENFFVPGAMYSVGDLLKALLVGSSNEAADALARTYGKTEFVAEMNLKAREWGLESTSFSDASGVSAANQTSAADLFKLSQKIFNEYPQILNITDNSKIVVLEKESGRASEVFSTHYFASRPEFLGGKTGTTPEAGENLVTFIFYGNRPIVIILLGAQGRFEYTDKLITWFKNDFSPGY